MPGYEAIAKDLKGVSNQILYDLVVYGARNGGKTTSFAALTVLKHRGATKTLQRALDGLSTDTRLFFEEELATLKI